MNHYDTLNVPADASTDDIKQAFRRKASAAHPDKGGSDETMARLNKAYAVLSSPERRAQYDETGDDREPAPLADKAAQYLTSLFSDQLERDGDIIQAVRTELSAAGQGAQAEIERLGKKVAKLSRRRSKISVKSGENLIHMLIDSQAASASREIAQFKELLEVIACTRALLEPYVSAEAAVPVRRPMDDSAERGFAWYGAQPFFASAGGR